MFDLGQQMTVSHIVAFQLIGHDDPWFVLQLPQQALEKALRDFAVSSFLHQDIKDDAILVDDPPQVVLPPCMRMNTLSMCQRSPGRGRRRFRRLAKVAANFRHHRRTVS